MRTLRSPLLLALALALATVAGMASAGEAKTPLGNWMKPHMGASLAGQDFAALQKDFGVVASKPPPGSGYADWSTIAKAGGAAAAKQDLAGVKAACKQCHTQYKRKYIADFPTRPFP